VAACLLAVLLATCPAHDWLARTVYFEARGEPIAGQLMVAHVVLARVESPRYPDTIEAVVTQDKGPRRWDCQFHWWCDGKGDTPRPGNAWRQAQGAAFMALLTGPPPDMPLHYHARSTPPAWCLVTVRSVGHHHLCLTTR
jgi:N-acetylmuramoyl-L-alanine amidase